MYDIAYRTNCITAFPPPLLKGGVVYLLPIRSFTVMKNHISSVVLEILRYKFSYIHPVNFIINKINFSFRFKNLAFLVIYNTDYDSPKSNKPNRFLISKKSVLS